MNGKGDSPRPLVVTREEYESNWERVFGKKKPESSKEKSEKKEGRRE